MEQTPELVIRLLRDGQIPSTVQGLKFYDLRPGFTIYENQENNNYDIIAECCAIMARNPEKALEGQRFLDALYREVIRPAYQQGSLYEPDGNLYHWAAATGQVRVFDENPGSNLLKAYFEEPDRKGRYPFDIAVRNGHISVVNALKDILSYRLNQACLSGNLVVAKQMIEICRHHNLLMPVLDPQDPQSHNTPLELACENGHTEIVMALLPYVNNVTSAFDYAVKNNQPELVHAILEKQQQVMGEEALRDFLNDTTRELPLEVACREGHVKLAETLFNFGANPLARGQHNLMSAFEVAQGTGNKELIEVFALFVNDDKNWQETKKYLAEMSKYMGERKEPQLPRTKLKHHLMREAVRILNDMNEGQQKGQISANNIRTTPIKVSDIQFTSPKQKAVFLDHLKKARNNAYLGDEPQTSLQDILDFHTKPALAKKPLMKAAKTAEELEKQTFLKKPRSAQEIARENDPKVMKQEAIRFIEDLITRLKKAKDRSPIKEKKEVLKVRRLAKIEGLQHLAAELKKDLEGDNQIRKLRQLCEFGRPGPTLVQLLNYHRNPDKVGKENTVSLDEFIEKFRLNKHDEVSTTLANRNNYDFEQEQGSMEVVHNPRETLYDVPLVTDDSDTGFNLKK